MPNKLFIFFVLCMVSALSSWSGAGTTPLNFEGPFQDALPLPLGRWTVNAVPFSSGLATEEVTIPESARLVFVPVCDSDAAAVLRCAIEMANERRTIYEKPIGANHRGPIESGMITSVDLGEFAHKTAKFVWEINTAAPAKNVKAGIGFARIVSAAVDTPPPDVILICSDTHRVDYSITGMGPELMPNFTKFAAKATVFDAAFANATWTIPSVSSLLTGMSPYRHGTGWRVEVNEELLGELKEGGAGLTTKFSDSRNYNITTHDKELQTLQEILLNKGYLTAAFMENGWVFFSEILFDGFVISSRPAHYLKGKRDQCLEGYAEKLMNAVPSGVPLFLYLHSTHVHDYINEETILEVSRGKEDASESLFKAAYIKRVKEFDAQLGEIFSVLEKAGRLENAIILFYSDHGEILWDDQASSWGHGKTMMDILLKVPLLVKLPGADGANSGRISDRVQLTDVFATVLERLNIAPPATMNQDAQGLIKRIVNDAPLPDRPFIAAIQFYNNEMAAVFDAKAKYVRDLTNEADEWYVREGDAYEAITDDTAWPHDVDRSSYTQLFEEEWRQFVERAKSRQVESFENPTDEQLETLRSLGYLE